MALTAAPDFTDGILTPARLQQLSDAINDRTPLRARMTADQTLATSSTVLQDITSLVVAVSAGATYEGILELAWTLAAGTTEDIKFGFTFPGSSTLDFGGAGPHTSLGAATAAGDGDFVRRMNATSGSTVIAFGASTNVAGAILIVNLAAGTNGNLQLQAAQNTSGGNAVTVKAGSRMTLHRIS